MHPFLIYGANGYTGELIARQAVARGLRPLLAGRNADKVRPLAERLGCDWRAVGLHDADALDAALGEVAFVVHCAGPFALTSDRMVEACLRTRRHYLDITGEIGVFEVLAARDRQAQDARVMLLPGVGFDVVPSDCLARHLKDRLPSATRLALAFYTSGQASHGTLATMVLHAGRGGAIRQGGQITRVPAAWKTRVIDFGGVRRTAVTIPWGDVSTAYHSTGIPNIEVYAVVPRRQLRMLRLTRYLGWLLATWPVRRCLTSLIPAGGPSDDARAQGRSLLWGEASDDAGRTVRARLRAPEGYTLTAQTAVRIAERLLAGEFRAGFQTPARCYGADLILQIEGVTRDDD